jgi:hypothetical protein
MKNAAAVALGKLRANTLSREQQVAAARAKWAAISAADKAAEMSRRRKLGIKRKTRTKAA